jgi:S-phase kinase-associated protein 1
MSDNKVKLVCSDGEVVEIDIDIAEKSVLIKGLIDDSGTEEQIPLPNVKRPILEKVVAFCIHLKDNASPEIEKPLKSVEMSSVVDPWYAQYIDLEQEILFELIMAANYLDIKNLTDASHPKELGTQFGIQTYEYLRYNMPETAVKVATMTENEALDLAQAIIATVRKKRNVTFLEIVK